MRFTPLHRAHFQSTDGSYSNVTEREVFDSQITLTDTESEIATGFFGNSIHRGNVKASQQAALKDFWHFNRQQAIKLNLVYPKKNREELRLYLSGTNGFKPTADDIWFLFVRDGKLNLGSYPKAQWRSIGRVDTEDEVYQSQITTAVFEHAEPKYGKIASRTTFLRDPRLAWKRFETAHFECEFDRSCRLFRSKSTGANFLECHHIIPIQFQQNFAPSLDFLENLIALCPFCHRAIHHAEVNLTREIIERILGTRSGLLDRLELSPERVFELYNCEEILT